MLKKIINHLVGSGVGAFLGFVSGPIFFVAGELEQNKPYKTTRLLLMTPFTCLYGTYKGTLIGLQGGIGEALKTPAHLGVTFLPDENAGEPLFQPDRDYHQEPLKIGTSTPFILRTTHATVSTRPISVNLNSLRQNDKVSTSLPPKLQEPSNDAPHSSPRSHFKR